jgi:Nuclease-related domain
MLDAMGSGTAGRSGELRFRQERREHMRADWGALALLVGCLVALAIWIALDDGWRQILAAIVFGSFATILVVGWMVGFDARSLRYAWGAAGEKWTAEELGQLEPRWRVFHDIRDGRGNWDHIVVGPGGIFLIDTKNLSEPAVVDDSGLRAGRLHYGGVRSRGAAMRLKEAIAQESGRTYWVQSVVSVWGELASGTTERDRVVYVRGAELVKRCAPKADV